MRRFLGPAVLVLVTLTALLWLRPHPPQPAVPPTATPGASHPSTLPPLQDQTPTPTTRASATPRPPRALQGRALAVAWLTGYLTRRNRNDDTWIAAIADLSTPELIQQLKEAGPDNVGLYQLTAWRVATITPYRAADQPVDTPSRVVLAYTAAVTDGRRTITKPFELTAYLASDGRWTITAVDQPYTSEG